MEKTVFVCCNIVIGYPRHTLQYCTVSSYRGSVLYTHKTSTIYGSFLPCRLLRCEALRHIIRTLYYDSIFTFYYIITREIVLEEIKVGWKNTTFMTTRTLGASMCMVLAMDTATYVRRPPAHTRPAWRNIFMNRCR